ncbi:MAG TPA: hypothetical protein VFJ57_12025 [Solirubrobacterales bacterium]|nr:hypothetical protein [Solirubrobacterales bacterium]
MTTLLVIGGILLAFGVFVVRSLLLDELKGRMQRKARSKIEETINSLPVQLQDEWGPEWRAEVASMSSMPLSALAFARGVRKSAADLAGEAALGPPAAARNEAAVPGRRRKGRGSRPSLLERLVGEGLRAMPVEALIRRVVSMVLWAGIIVFTLATTLGVFSEGLTWRTAVLLGLSLGVLGFAIVVFTVFELRDKRRI